MEILCDRTTLIGKIKRTSRLTLFRYRLKIKFNFSFNSLYYNTGATDDQDPVTFQSYYMITTSVIFRESLSYDVIREEIQKAIGSYLLDDDDGQLLRVMKRVWRAVRKKFPSGKTLPRFTVCDFDVPLWFMHWHHYHHMVERERNHMVPAADSALGMLDKYEVDGTESCCCICLQEVGGGGGDAMLRMPCLHVFHGGCIKEWLGTSHYCPICRYEMPTE